MWHRFGKLGLLASMAAAVLAVAGLAYWDDARESRAALEDFAREQATLAQSAAVDLSGRLAAIQRDARIVAAEKHLGPRPTGVLELPYLGVTVRPAGEPGRPGAEPPSGGSLPISVLLADGSSVGFRVPTLELFDGLRQIERPGSLRVLIQAPGEPFFRTTDARTLVRAELSGALAQGAPTLRLPGDVAAGLGLPARTAMVGLARIDTRGLGHWGVVVAATAERERDRERGAQRRLILAVGLASGLVLAFGGAALVLQRKELALSRKLELARLTRENDERLARLSKAATTLTLASGVAHELGTPLGVIVGRAEQLAIRLKEDERSLKNARAILEQADRIHQVVRGFLDLARGGSPSFQRVTPKEVVLGVRELVLHRFEGAGVWLELSAPDWLPPLWCDLRLLQHALINLLLNACDASPPGSTVHLRVEPDDAAASFLVIDQGSGIPEAVAAHVVSPFFTTKPEGKGTGLGLAIAKEIAISHHGSLAIGPGEGHGTRAVLQIPFDAGGQTAHG